MNDTEWERQNLRQETAEYAAYLREQASDKIKQVLSKTRTWMTAKEIFEVIPTEFKQLGFETSRAIGGLCIALCNSNAIVRSTTPTKDVSIYHEKFPEWAET